MTLRATGLAAVHRACRPLMTATGTFELAELACHLVATYLGADAVEMETPEGDYRWGSRPEAVPPAGLCPLETAIGQVGTLRWWGSQLAPLDEEGRLGMELIADRIAIEFEHSRLLDATEARGLRDHLTGVLNRAGALHALSDLAAPWALALLDIDNFRAVNDKFGTDEGDRVLQRLAMVLMQGRFGDVVARWGGDEFLVALPGADGAGATNRLRRVLERVQETVRAGVQPVTFACGIALVDEDGLDRGLGRADQALFTAKRAGPGTIVTQGS
jgi:diguanylate cyclase (GGDEF)-like protein